MNLRDNYHMAMIGNGRSAALIDHAGSMVFACLPDFDSGSIFCRLLDEDKGGELATTIEGGHVVEQAYRAHTNLLSTRYESADGAFEMIDFMPRYRLHGTTDEPFSPPDIVRVLRPLHGKPRVRVRYDPRLEFAALDTVTSKLDDGQFKSAARGKFLGHSVYESIYLYSDLPNGAILDGDVHELDQERFILISYNDKLQEPNRESVRLMRAQTEAYWLSWVARTPVPSYYREEVLRSALTLKMMQYSPTGALVAAPTTSLPEAPGEERNWDYRFCWLRDASMTVSVLLRIGHEDMAHRFVEWVLRTTPTKDDPLQIMYGLRGEQKLTEHELPHLDGYHGSRPVRVGNAAFKQKQHDIYGSVLDVFWQTLPHFGSRLDQIEDMWTRARSVARTVRSVWQKADRGIWEFRGNKRHFTFSKLLCWVAIDRAVKIGLTLGRREWAAEHRKVADEIREDILHKAWSEEVGAFTQSYGSSELDASSLLLADYGLIDPLDPRFIATVEKTWEVLGRGEGLLMRYANADDFGVPSSAFTICCFWGVKALAQIGQIDRAEAAFEALVGYSNHVGLMAEDLRTTDHRQIGNFPQAYSHLAMIDAALELGRFREGSPRLHISDSCAS